MHLKPQRFRTRERLSAFRRQALRQEFTVNGTGNLVARPIVHSGQETVALPGSSLLPHVRFPGFRSRRTKGSVLRFEVVL